MNPSRVGVSGAGKRAIVAVLVVLVLGSVFIAASFSKGGLSVSSSSLAESKLTPIGNQTGMYALLGAFPQMTVSVDFYDEPDGLIENSTFSYTVLGTATLNSTQYTKVDFTTAGSGDEVIAWFNSTGGVNRVDVVGEKNYTGAGAYVLAAGYTSAFATIPTITNNSTLISLLNETSPPSTTSIGPTKVNVATYTLGAETATYANITARYATIPGSKVVLAVYLDEKLRNQSTTLIQVTSLSQ